MEVLDNITTKGVKEKTKSNQGKTVQLKALFDFGSLFCFFLNKTIKENQFPNKRKTHVSFPRQKVKLCKNIYI